MKNCPKCQNEDENSARTCGLCRHNYESKQTLQTAPVRRKVVKYRKSGFPYFDY